jgi:hypothetical protein
LDEEIWMHEMMVKLSGPIFTHAQMKKDIYRTYFYVFDKIFSTDFRNEMHLLEIFGNVGG